MQNITKKDKFQAIFPQIHEWDVSNLNKIYNRYDGKKLQKTAKYISFFADPRLWGILTLVLGVYGTIYKKFSYLIIFLSAFFQSYLFYYVFKEFFKRPRPFIQFENIKHLDKTGHGYSFPSGHCHHSTILISLIWLVFFPRLWLFPLILVYNFLIGLSRIISGCHFPTDTIFGTIEAYVEIALFWFISKDLYLGIYEMLIDLLI